MSFELEVIFVYESVTISTYVCGVIMLIGCIATLLYLYKTIKEQMRIFDELRAYSIRTKPKHESYKSIYAVIVLFVLQWVFLMWNEK